MACGIFFPLWKMKFEVVPGRMDDRELRRWWLRTGSLNKVADTNQGAQRVWHSLGGGASL